MAIAYFDCFAGVAGDMIVAALLDAGADFQALSAELDKLGLDGVSLDRRPVRRAGIAGTAFCVRQCPPAVVPERHLSDILDLIGAARLPDRARERAEEIFTRLGRAEAKVHGIDIEEVHFHEVGAVDSIVDVVAACVAMELLEIDRILCSPIPVGSGTVQCAHGTLPLPAPATAQLLIGAETFAGANPGELTTPTGAAVMTTLAESFAPMPAMRVDRVGCGAGTRDEGPVANLLRVFIGREDQTAQVDTVVELSANIDDSTGETLGAAIDAMLTAGCLDVWAQPIFMKKSRPAWMLCAICSEGDVARAQEILFSETTTFGVRRRVLQRTKLSRHYETVETPYGPIRIKIGLLGERRMSASPEFSDCLDAARTHHVSAREVLLAAQLVYRGKNAP